MRLILSIHFWATKFFALIRLYLSVTNAEKKNWPVLLLLSAFIFPATAADFTPGNIVVLRVGSGASGLVNTGAAVFLDEYTPAGVFVQSIALPTSVSGANKRLILSGTATSEGMITRSEDGKYIMVYGYDAAIPTTDLAGTTAAAVNRVVARVDKNGNINTTTALTDAATGNNPRGVTSTNGTDIWVTGGAGGIRYTTLGSTTSTQLSTTVTNLRGVEVFGGQLYISTSSGTAVRIGAVGSGTPATSGQTITNIPGFTTSGSPYGFFFADLNAGIPGADVLYVANDDAVALTKYSLVGGNWVSNGTIGVNADDYRGLSGVVSGSNVTLYAVRKGGTGSTGGGELVSLTDASGYNGSFSGTPALLATAITNTSFRGIVSAPTSTLPTVDLSVSANSGSEAGTTAITVTATASGPVSGNQTVSLAASGTNITAGDYTLSANSITILNGQTAGSVTFTIVDDALTEGSETAALTISNPSSGITLGTAVVQNITITDNDVLTAGVTIAESGGTTNVAEGGATDTYTVVLTGQPTADVTITVNAGTQVTANPASLTFTAVNWYTPQQVTVTAVDDALPEASPHTGTITHTAAGSDGAYNGISISSVTANITDNDNTVPAIAANNLTNYLNVPANGPGYVSGVISDPTDPAAAIGIGFTVADVETDVNALTLTAASSNTATVPNANLVITGSGSSRTLKITPSGVGYSDITVTVNDGLTTASYIIKYAASAASSTPSATRFLTGVSDASTAQAIDADYVFVADDENQGLRLYNRSNSGLPSAVFDMNSNLGLTDISGGVPREVDIESSTRSGNRIYWLGSHSNSSNGSSRPNRYRLFATDISGSGTGSTLSYAGRYDNLRADLLSWDASNGHGLGADYLGLTAAATIGLIPESSNLDGFNIEGLVFAPDGTTGYVAFRAPNLPAANRNRALIIPWTNITSLVSGNPTTGPATFGTPIFLDLGGRGIREIKRNAGGQYLIAAGPADGATGTAPKDFRLYTWTGNASDAPLLRAVNLTALNADGSFESIVEVPESLSAGSQIELLVDNGDAVFYNDGVIAKELPQNNWKKFRREIVTLGEVVVPTKISAVQGSGSTSPIVGQTVTIRGIVVGDFEATLSGVYVQEEDADIDADPATSEGIFVFKNNTFNNFAEGDLVFVTGTVAEFTSSSGGNTSSLTQITSPNILKLSSGNPLPTPATLQLPITNVSDFERYEGMSVTLTAASGNLAVTDNFTLGRFGQLLLSASGDNDEADTDARLDQFTQFNAPSVGGYAASLAANARRSIILDDGRTVQNPDPVIFGRGGNILSASNTLRTGDQVASVSGIFDHRFEGYRVQTLTSPNFIASNARPATPSSVGASTLKVAGFNILNYFNGNGTGGGFPTSRGAETTTEFTRQRDKIIQAIISSEADVIGLMELENDGYGSTSAIQDLINGLNSATGAGTYDFVNPGGSISSDEITVGIIFKPGKVEMAGAAAAIPFNFGTGSFTTVGRRSLAQTIKQKSNNALFTFVVNHFKSKGSSSGGSGDADANDGQGFSNGTRTRQAQDLAGWLATKPTGTNDPDYLIMGDLNAYAKEDPLTTLATGGYLNLLANTTYSYSFDGAFGALDHALAVASLSSQVTGATKWHVNADEPIILDYNTNFKSAGQITSFYNNDAFRASDHDPILVGLNLCASSTVTLTSAAISDTQTVCNNTPIVNITYAIGGTGANVTGLPDGVTGNFANGVLTISGTPTLGGTFQYTVTTVGGCSPDATATGLLQINSPANESLNVTVPITSGSVTLVAGTITATNQVSGATVEYRGTQYVTLLPGFSAIGNSFLARIGGCN